MFETFQCFKSAKIELYSNYERNLIVTPIVIVPTLCLPFIYNGDGSFLCATWKARYWIEYTFLAAAFM